LGRYRHSRDTRAHSGRSQRPRRPCRSGQGPGDAALHEVGHAVSRCAQARPRTARPPAVRRARHHRPGDVAGHGPSALARGDLPRGALPGHRTDRPSDGPRVAGVWRAPSSVPPSQELSVTGAWWDFVDELAIRRVGPILRNYRDELTPLMRSWARHDDLWLRRAAVICQVTAKDQTDPDLLADVIAATLHDKDFFLRKGIGWALRDYAKTEPGWVRAFVDAHPDLSPLSRREALKHL